VRFDSVERDGVEQPVAFRPVDDGVRRSPPPQMMGRRMQTVVRTNDEKLERPAGSGLFVFYDAGRLMLDRKFESEWETK
jgi:hypothetical protein